MKQDLKVLVLGGNGFIGRHAVAHLEKAGVAVTVGTRSPNAAAARSEARIVLHERIQPDAWHEDVARYDVILNCVGILRQRYKETYEAVHHLAPAALAQACARAGKRMVHVSALGLTETARSRFITSKHRGERAIWQTGGKCVVARLSLLDGEGGYGAAWLRGVAKLPFFIVPTSATGKIAALTADNAGEALCRVCLDETREESLLELGGNTPYSFDEYIRGLRKRYTKKRALCIRVPGLLARAGAHLFDVVHFSPFSFGHWELLCTDNVPDKPDLQVILGRAPDKVIE